jgi:hypothetical protein
LFYNYQPSVFSSLFGVGLFTIFPSISTEHHSYYLEEIESIQFLTYSTLPYDTHFKVILQPYIQGQKKISFNFSTLEGEPIQPSEDCPPPTYLHTAPVNVRMDVDINSDFNTLSNGISYTLYFVNLTDLSTSLNLTKLTLNLRYRAYTPCFGPLIVRQSQGNILYFPLEKNDTFYFRDLFNNSKLVVDPSWPMSSYFCCMKPYPGNGTSMVNSNLQVFSFSLLFKVINIYTFYID